MHTEANLAETVTPVQMSGIQVTDISDMGRGEIAELISDTRDLLAQPMIQSFRSQLRRAVRCMEFELEDRVGV